MIPFFAETSFTVTLTEFCEIILAAGVIVSFCSVLVTLLVGSRFVNRSECEKLHAATDSMRAAAVVRLTVVEQTVATNSVKIRMLEDRKNLIESLAHRQEELEKQAALTQQPINAFQSTMEEVKDLLRQYMAKMETFTIDIERRVTVLETRDKQNQKRSSQDQG